MSPSEQRVVALTEALVRLDRARTEYDTAVATLEDLKRLARPWEVATARVRATHAALVEGRRP